MKSLEPKDKDQKPLYSDQEIIEVAEWLNELSLQQLIFLKQSYDAFLSMEAMHMGNTHVH